VEMTIEELNSKSFMAWDDEYPENPRLDLKAVNGYQLTTTGVHQIDVFPYCTKCQPEEFFSFRRGEDGRNSAFMMLR
jgi:copper oxidase (laccase) domain-containing protein